jgi:hypothetical protein
MEAFEIHSHYTIYNHCMSIIWLVFGPPILVVWFIVECLVVHKHQVYVA